LHPTLVGMHGDPGDGDSSTIQVHEKQHNTADYWVIKSRFCDRNLSLPARHLWQIGIRSTAVMPGTYVPPFR
jgi:hypothetical protein